jgi:chromosome segregation ATPase
LTTVKSEGEKFKHGAIGAKMKLQLKEKALTEANKMTDNFSEQITMLKSEGDDLRLELKEAEEKSEQLQAEKKSEQLQCEGEKFKHDAIAAKMKLQLKEKELTEAKEKTVNLSVTTLKSEGDDLRLELKEAEKRSEQLQHELTTVKSEGEKFKHGAIGAKMKLQLKEKALTEANKMTDNFSEQITS